MYEAIKRSLENNRRIRLPSGHVSELLDSDEHSLWSQIHIDDLTFEERNGRA
jgi:hypothetical protein